MTVPNPASAILIEGLSKRFGATLAVDGLDLRVAPGEIYAFLGPNGAGKTTTVKLLAGLLRPSEGRISIAGIDMAGDPQRAKSRLGLVTDQPFIYAHLTGEEFLRFIGDLYGVPPAGRADQISSLLSLFELQPHAHHLVGSYSHGMRQKLALAGMLLHRPEVVLLDEPLVGLDPKSARLVKDVLAELARRGTTIFMCTHVLEIAERLAGRIGIIAGGRLIAQGSMDDLRSRRAASASLEDIFLELTAGERYAELMRYL